MTKQAKTLAEVRDQACALAAEAQGDIRKLDMVHEAANALGKSINSCKVHLEGCKLAKKEPEGDWAKFIGVYMLTGQQQKLFQPLKTAAWRTHCARTGTDPKDRIASDKWYRQALVEGVGVFSTKQVSPRDRDMFDRLCMHFAVLSGQDSQIAYWSKAVERRLLFIIQERMEQYVNGIARQMGYLGGSEKSYKDLPAEHLQKIFVALDKHVKQEDVLPEHVLQQEEVPF